MASVQQSELVEFHQYLTEHLQDAEPHRSPEELLDEWRLQRGDIAGHKDDVEAIRAALRDMDAGEVGMDAREFLRELDAEIQQRMSK